MAADRRAAEQQIGRPLRGDVRVAARCPCGLPSVIETYPLVDDAPFPTLFWLTCVRASAEVSRLESSGLMREMNERLVHDPQFAERVARSHSDYIARRDAHHVLRPARGIGGGPLDRIKCLHAHYAHHLVAGDNPVGEWIDSLIGRPARPPPCLEADQP